MHLMLVTGFGARALFSFVGYCYRLLGNVGTGDTRAAIANAHHHAKKGKRFEALKSKISSFVHFQIKASASCIPARWVECIQFLFPVQ